MDERLAIYLDQMLEAARNAVAFTAGTAFGDFVADKKTTAAVMMCFVIIGESAAKIERRSPGFIEDHPDWPWKSMRGMRNVAAHSYADIEFEQVWESVTKSLPLLISQIEALGPLDPRR